MEVVRRLSLLMTAGLLGIAVMLGWVGARPSMSVDAAGRMAGGVAHFDSTIVLARNARPAGARGDALAIALGYLERERLGLADPFRLVDEALHDPRIDAGTRQHVAWALLGRLRRGDAFVQDPAVLDGAGPWSRDGRGATGTAHLALIERALTAATDPRAGELAVRLAYMIEGGKGTLAGSAPLIATEVAALVRDRLLATADLHDLLSDAAAQHTDVLPMVVARRSARVLRVEQPVRNPMPERLRIEAMNLVPGLVAELESLDALDALDRPSGDQTGSATAPVITGHFAARLSRLALARPTIAQLAVTLRTATGSRLSAANEEALAAEYATLVAESDSARRAPALAVLAGANAMRVYAQSAPWFPGDPSPTVADLSSEFGLRTVTFARTVPENWRGYYLRELATSLRDMRTVFPAISVEGLSIAVGTASLPDSALAMHDPRARRLDLSISTSAGTLAHELAHDLDWQTSRRLFATSGGYSTDHAVREERGALAASMRGLTQSRLMRSPSAGASARPSDRPAEVFARGVDWFVASALAADGRVDGFLSAIQDPAIPGYAAGAPAAVGVNGAASLLAAIDQMTFVDDSTRDGFMAAWSDPATIDPVLMVRRVLSAPLSRGAFVRQGGLSGMLALPTPALCVNGGAAETKARGRVLALAVEARAHGVAMRRARYRFPGAESDWTRGLLGMPPWDGGPARTFVTSLESAVIGELRGTTTEQSPVPMVPAPFRENAGVCRSLSRWAQ